MKINDKVKSWRHNAILILKSITPDEDDMVEIEYKGEMYLEDINELKKII